MDKETIKAVIALLLVVAYFTFLIVSLIVDSRFGLSAYAIFGSLLVLFILVLALKPRK